MDRLPILPLGQLVVYPHVVLPMALSDPNAVHLIDEVVQGNKRLLLGVVKPLAGGEPPEGGVTPARPGRLQPAHRRSPPRALTNHARHAALENRKAKLRTTVTDQTPMA